MVRFVPKEIRDNINISSQSPLKEFFLLLSALLGIIILIYVALGFALDFVVPKLPAEVEMRLGRMYSRVYEVKKEKRFLETEAELQRILEDLLKEANFKEPFKVYLICDSKANAFALPGNIIIVTSALIKELDSENEVAFVLGHELGHFANRDHLRGLGRGLVLLTISTILFGADNSVSQLLENSLQNVEMKFSQAAEKKADLFGLELLKRRYGHVGGATDFFEKLKKKEKIPRFLYFLASHPHPLDRIKALEQEIAKRGYLIKETVPLKNFLNINSVKN